MGLIGIIIFGAVVGLLADFIDKKNDNKWYIDIIFGIVGSLVGAFVRNLFTNNDAGAFSFDIWTFLTALAGTLLVLAAYHAALGNKNRDRF